MCTKLNTRVWLQAIAIASSCAIALVLLLTTSTEAPRLRFLRRGRDHAGFALLRPLQLDRELVLHLAQRGEILVELDLVGLADIGHQRLALVGDRREHALVQHDVGIGLPVVAVGILEAFAEDALVERQRRRLRRRERRRPCAWNS